MLTILTRLLQKTDSLTKLNEVKTIKIVYDEPWFCICSANHFQKNNFVSGEDLLIRKRQNQRLRYSKKKIENNFDLNVK